MIRKSVQRFSLATNAERVCAEIMRKQRSFLFSREGRAAFGVDRDADLGAERPAHERVIAGRAQQEAVMAGAIDLQIDMATLIDLSRDAPGHRAGLGRTHQSKLLRSHEQIDRA